MGWVEPTAFLELLGIFSILFYLILSLVCYHNSHIKHDVACWCLLSHYNAAHTLTLFHLTGNGDENFKIKNWIKWKIMLLNWWCDFWVLLKFINPIAISYIALDMYVVAWIWGKRQEYDTNDKRLSWNNPTAFRRILPFVCWCPTHSNARAALSFDRREFLKFLVCLHNCDLQAKWQSITAI